MAKDPQILAHQEWLGYVQPVGLVVSIPALIQAQANVDRGIIPQHQRFLDAISPPPTSAILDFPTFVQTVFGWREQDLIGRPGGEPLPATLEVALPEYGEGLRPTYALCEDHPADPAKPWLMLVQELTVGTLFDANSAEHDRQWQASPQSRMERLLRETQVGIGLLVNGTGIRLVYAPRGENSGYVTFNVGHMATVAGRPIFAALHMLLCADRLFTESPDRRLPALLANSRKHQSLVSNQLAEQVLASLYELVRGFQAANDVRQGDLLRDVLKDDPNQVYGGLLNVLMRLVFILFAEDRGLISTDPVYANFYSVTGLFDRLRADAGRYPDTMDQRFGAWAQLLTLFRLIYDGGAHGGFSIPAREGYLFDPDRYPFLEGRPWRSKRETGQRLQIPRVPDGVVYRVLQNLLILDGERLSYRTLDVEQIGSVYETMMGFNLEVAQGQSIAMKPAKAHGAPATINLEALLATDGGKRAKWLSDNADQKLTGQASEALASATSIDELLLALDKKIAKKVTPYTVPRGVMVLQPSDERRKSGSHYTPRSLTDPIVRKTLLPVLKRLGERPKPQELLDLKICDPAMGSGAFLVEVCRQLGDELVRAWHLHGQLPKLPPDEDEVLHSRRLIAQRCLYGVDKNSMAVDLAKLSLWLATLAKDHPFTFLDHSLRHGDSLVGLTSSQIEAFHWLPSNERQFGQEHITRRIEEATRYRTEILDADDNTIPALKRQKLAVADDRLNAVRFCGDLVIAAFFAGNKEKVRRQARNDLLARLTSYLDSGDLAKRPTEAEKLRTGRHPIFPFHWNIEFSEVFGHGRGGFDAIVGNPPFLGGPVLSELFGGPEYQEWLKTSNQGGFGNADLAAYFFRKAFDMIHNAGTFGLLATNSISEGSTRISGLKPILESGGIIYDALRALRWPGEAAVIVAVVHIARAGLEGLVVPHLDGRQVPAIDSRLLPHFQSSDPICLLANENKAFVGSDLRSVGFLLDRNEYLLLSRNTAHVDRLMPMLGGEEINSSPTQSNERYAINFGSCSLEEAMRYPALLEIVRERVKPQRDRQRDHGPGMHGKKFWWQYALRGDPLYQAISSLQRCLVSAITTTYFAYSFQPIRQVFAHTLAVFAFDNYGPFACLQSQVHTHWSRLLSSSLGLGLRYSVGDAFQTFPFPRRFEDNTSLERVGQEFYDYRATLMIDNSEGLTATYNRFHNPYEGSTEILKLRELHAAMDRTVLDAYGWTDIPTDCEFLLDFEQDDDDATDTQPSAARRKKKPSRYRWPDAVRDEVLARLLALNAERAKEEAGAPSTKAAPKPRKDRKGETSEVPSQSLF